MRSIAKGRHAVWVWTLLAILPCLACSKMSEHIKSESVAG